MLICHKRVASNEAAGLQACHMSDVHPRSGGFQRDSGFLGLYFQTFMKSGVLKLLIYVKFV